MSSLDKIMELLSWAWKEVKSNGEHEVVAGKICGFKAW